jgi:hypothetical protein
MADMEVKEILHIDRVDTPPGEGDDKAHSSAHTLALNTLFFFAHS